MMYEAAVGNQAMAAVQMVRGEACAHVEGMQHVGRGEARALTAMDAAMIAVPACCGSPSSHGPRFVSHRASGSGKVLDVPPAA